MTTPMNTADVTTKDMGYISFLKLLSTYLTGRAVLRLAFDLARQNPAARTRRKRRND